MIAAIILAILLFAGKVLAAVAYDTESHAAFTNVSSGSWTHTPVGSTNLAVFCSVAIDDFNNFSPGTALTGYTYGGTSMSTITSGSTTAGGQMLAEIRYRAAPSSSAQTVAWTTAAGVDFFGNCVSFTGANQTTPAGTGSTGDMTTGVSITVPTNGIAF